MAAKSKLKQPITDVFNSKKKNGIYRSFYFATRNLKTSLPVQMSQIRTPTKKPNEMFDSNCCNTHHQYY